MERRNEIRQRCELDSLVLMFGCHVRGWISDCSPKGLGLVLSEGVELADQEPLVLYCDLFGVLHAEIIWKQDAKIGARIRNWKTAAVGSRIRPYLLQPSRI